MQASFGGQLSSLFGQRFALAVASPVDACSPLNNSGPISGTIVLIQRGACFMSTKVRSMQGTDRLGVALFRLDPGSAWMTFSFFPQRGAPRDFFVCG
jgi:hypothetical protein